MTVVELTTDFSARLMKSLLFVVLGAIGYQLLAYIYNIFLHPLRKFPGPILCRASCLPLISSSLKGEQVYWLTELHAIYGEVVRYSPNELSFSSADAWKDIYGHKRAGQPTLLKNPKFYLAPVQNEHERVYNIIDSNSQDHSRIRRIFSGAFSDRALKLQEPLFLKYVNKLIGKLQDVVSNEPNHKFNMVSMYNFTTFDIMGDLAFGEPLQLLDDTKYHPWLKSMFASFKFGMYLHVIRYFAFVETVLLGLLPRIDPGITEKRKLHTEFSRARVDRRLEKKEARPDIWGLVLERDEKLGMTRDEMYSNANLFMIAGTETTATLLSGLTYYLLVNPDKLQILTHEIRSTFKTSEEIDIVKLQNLKYLHACIEEGLRLYPPVSNGLSRLVPVGGVNVAGHYIPGGSNIAIQVTNLATYRNPNNFKDPYDFVPERWLSEEYASDKKHALQPFSIGPRNCLGKNMAYHEIRIILAKVLWSFDIKLCPESRNWIDQKVYIMWEKGELQCQLVPVNRDSSHR